MPLAVPRACGDRHPGLARITTSPCKGELWTIPHLVDTKISGKYNRRGEKDGKERH
jgi:hypothetical protein